MAAEKNRNADAREDLYSQPDSPSPSHLEASKPRTVDTDEDDEFTYEEQRKIVHRIDRRLVVILGLMYCVSLIDRGNMPNAAIAGMHTDLATDVGYRYSIATLVFFVTYTIFQPPATIVTRKLGPRNFLPAICVAWGAVMVRFTKAPPLTRSANTLQIGFGFINNWTVLIPLRLLLGFFEAGYFPGKIAAAAPWEARTDCP